MVVFANTVKAFRSPILAECGSIATGRDLASSVRDVPIQYGSTRDPENEKTRLAFADTRFVDPPRKGERFEL